MSISHRTNRLKLVGTPSVEKLQNGRYKLTVTCSTMNSREDWYSANKARIFPDFGSLQSAEMSIDGLAPRTGEAYADMRLTQVESGNRSLRDGGDYLVALTYETLGSAFVQVKDDNTDYELNGLRRVTRTSIAEAGTDYAKTVGTSFIDHQIDAETAVRCYLASYGIDDTDSFRQVQEVYIEAGVLSRDSRPAPAQLAGCTYVTVRSLGTPVTPTGVLVAESETESDGYITYEKTALQGTIVETKQTYKDVVDVTVAGIVNCTQVSKSSGGISGTIAVTQVTPPRTKTLAATVTVEVTTSPPDTAALAYDLGDISCSVTSISMSENFRGTDVFTTSSGNSRYSGQRKAADMSARISTYPNCHLSSATGSGEFSYTSSYQNDSTNPNSIVATAQTSTTKTFTDGTGSTSASYSTTGVVRRNSRPILTALNGTVYFEVITWTV